MQPQVGGSSPWGPIQTVKPFGDGLYVVTTSTHGGAYVPPELMHHIPGPHRETNFSSGGWFEEDCDIAIPICFCPGFSDEEVAKAKEVLDRWHPDWRKHYS